MTRIPARYGRAFRLERGQTLHVGTETGSQVADAWAVAAEDPAEHLSMDHTRSVNSNIFVTRGSRLVSNLRRRMLTVTDDTSSARHDTLLCPCTAELYRELCAPDGHRSCTGNLHEALAEVGLSLPFTPASLNLFMNVPVDQDGQVDRLPPVCSPGDSVSLRAEMDVVIVLSACPQDITPINGVHCTPSDLFARITDPPRREQEEL